MKTGICALFFIVTFFVSSAVVAKVSEPVQWIWATFFGVEVRSSASFPMGHMARIYSTPGFGDQQLICIVDGAQIYRTPDWEPGDVHEEIVWDKSGKVVTFIASGRRFYSYNTETGIGTKE